MPTNMHAACYLPTGHSSTTPELAHLLPPHSLATVPVAQASYSCRARSASTQCGHSQIPAGTLVSAGSRDPMCHPSKQ
jgi:hypothetical protein